MASAVVAVVGSAIVNAVAFSGSNFLFSRMDKDAAAAEARKRQDAIDKYNRDRDNYNEYLRKRNEFLANRHQEQVESEQKFRDVSSDLAEYYRISSDKKEAEPEPVEEPKFDYKPSEKQADLELAFQAIGTLCAVIGAYVLL